MKRAALWGAFLAPIVVILRFVLLGDQPPEDVASLIGYALGSLVGGALLFVAAAWVMNTVRR